MLGFEAPGTAVSVGWALCKRSAPHEQGSTPGLCHALIGADGQDGVPRAGPHQIVLWSSPAATPGINAD